MEFKVGDRVRQTRNCSSAVKGEMYIVGKVKDSDQLWVGNKIDSEGFVNSGLCFCQHLWESVETCFGQKVLVRHSESEQWAERIFLFEDQREGVDRPYFCVYLGEEDNFNDKGDHRTYTWEYIKPLDSKVDIVCEGKTVSISRESAIALGLVK